MPGRGETPGARGDTWHGLVNFQGSSAIPLVDSLSWNMEYTWSYCNHVTQGVQYFKGRGKGTFATRPTVLTTNAQQDPRFYRPAEVDLLISDPSKAKNELGWVAKTSFKALVEMMVESDLQRLSKK